MKEKFEYAKYEGLELVLMDLKSASLHPSKEANICDGWYEYDEKTRTLTVSYRGMSIKRVGHIKTTEIIDLDEEFQSSVKYKGEAWDVPLHLLMWPCSTKKKNRWWELWKYLTTEFVLPSGTSLSRSIPPEITKCEDRATVTHILGDSQGFKITDQRQPLTPSSH